MSEETYPFGNFITQISVGESCRPNYETSSANYSRKSPGRLRWMNSWLRRKNDVRCNFHTMFNRRLRAIHQRVSLLAVQSQPGTLDGGLKLNPLKECSDCGAVIEERDHDELTVRSLPCVCSHLENNPPAIDPYSWGMEEEE